MIIEAIHHNCDTLGSCLTVISCSRCKQYHGFALFEIQYICSYDDILDKLGDLSETH